MADEMESSTDREKESADEKNWEKLRISLNQITTAMGPIMSTISIGITFGQSAVLLPQLSTGNNSSSLMDENRIVLESTEEESWVAASATLLMAPGCWLAGFLMEVLGRRTSHLVLSPVFLLGFLVVGLAPNFLVLLIGRALCGLCSGIQAPLGPVYVAETSNPRLRGVLLAGISLAVALGILISHVLGALLPWRIAAYSSSLFPILCFIFCLCGAESPAWLARKKKPEEALRAWARLRGSACSGELNSTKNASPPDDSPEKRTPLWRSAALLKPLLILNVFFLTSQFSGVNAVTFYCVRMLKDISGPGENALSSTLILDVVRTLASVLACWLTRRCSRRVLAVVSGLGSSVSLLGLSTVLFLDLGKPWLPVILLLLYTCVVSIGLVPLPWLLCGELFPVAVRGLGSGLSSGFAFLCFFVVVKTGPAMLEDLGASETFLIYGSIALSGTIFLYLWLPETKDRTLGEIEEIFAGKPESRRDSPKNNTV